MLQRTLAVLVLILTALSPAAARESVTQAQSASASSCSKSIRPYPNSPADSSSYQNRGDRCEGSFQPNVNAELALVSLTRGAIQLSPADSSAVEITWTATAAGVQIRALIETTGAAWRMDSSSTSASRRFVWNLDPLRAWLDSNKQVQIDQLGLTARGRTAQQQDVFVPLNVGSLAPTDTYKLVLATSVDVSLVVTSATYRTVPGDRVPLWRDQKLEGDKFPANSPIVIDFPTVDKPSGLIDVEVRALGSGIMSAKFTLFHK